MTEKEVATIAIALFDAITELLGETPNTHFDMEVVNYINKVNHFSEIYKALIHQRFSLERIKRDSP